MWALIETGDDLRLYKYPFHRAFGNGPTFNLSCSGAHLVELGWRTRTYDARRCGHH